MRGIAPAQRYRQRGRINRSMRKGYRAANKIQDLK